MEQINFSTFFNENSLSIDDNTLFLINTIKNTTTVDNKIDNIETDYLDKIKELKLAFETENTNSIYSKKKAIEIIQKELEIIQLISKYSLQNNKLEFVFVISSLKYLLQLSEILRIKLKQPSITISKLNKLGIIRCSYKFCNFKDSCVYNYSRKGNCCYQDHYVHNMVSHDISALIMYLEANNVTGNNTMIVHNKEILKSINTLSFVITHMESELRTKCMYMEVKDWESFHYVHNLKG